MGPHTRGKLILVVGVPGSGKSTLIAHAREVFPALVSSVSWTTRAPRPGEEDGDVYHFVTDGEFSASVARGEFIEWVTIDTGHKYGTRKEEIIPHLQNGRTVIREVEVQGARAIRNMMPEDVATIFVWTDSWENLAQRILARAPISEEELEARRKRYEKEILFKDEADFVVQNRENCLEDAKKEFKAAVSHIVAGK